jgi:hypothetical protein
MELLESKEIIVNEINKLFTSYNSVVKENTSIHGDLNNEIKRLNKFNEKLLQEISEKDKYLLLNEKKLHDYEQMINKIQEEANKEMDANNRGNMIRILDKENNEKDLIIQQLNQKINNLDCKLKQLSETNIDLVINENIDSNLNENSNDNVDDKIIGWSPTSSKQPVIDNSNDKKINEETNNDTLNDEESDDGAVVEIITHYKKEYYIIEGEDPQYIYAIEDGELGDKVGEMKGKKKVFY